jgi:CBS domain containing-hemolysin-like protein
LTESGHIGWQLVLQLILILLNAVFACAEIAVITMNDNKIAKRSDSGDKRAVRLEKLTARPARFLATIQVGITFAGFLGSAFAADNFSEKLTMWLLDIGVGIRPRRSTRSPLSSSRSFWRILRSFWASLSRNGSPCATPTSWRWPSPGLSP